MSTASASAPAARLTFDPHGAVAFVTGASRPRGIGRAIVLALVAAGAKRVYATARRAEALEDLARANPGVIVPVALDVTDAKAVAEIGHRFTDVNLLVNNAGVLNGASALEGDLASIENEIAVNYLAPLRLVRALNPALKAHRSSAVVNINSIVSLFNFPGGATYSASKAAAHSLTIAQRRELRRQGTLVVGIYPGPIDTEMGDSINLPKAPPAQVAAAVINALRTGAEDIFPDALSVDISAGLKADAKQVERNFEELAAAAH